MLKWLQDWGWQWPKYLMQAGCKAQMAEQAGGWLTLLASSKHHPQPLAVGACFAFPSYSAGSSTRSLAELGRWASFTMHT